MIKKAKTIFVEIKNSIDPISVRVEGFYFMLFLSMYIILFSIAWLFGIHISSDTIWFWSGIIMLIFSLYYIEPYFTAPTNVFANSVALLLLVSSLGSKDFGSLFWWVTVIIILFLMSVFSLISKAIYNKNKSEDFIINKISGYTNIVLAKIGQGRVLYSLFFLYFLLLNVVQKNNFSDVSILSLFLFFCFVLIIQPGEIKKSLKNIFEINDKEKSGNLGKIFAVQSDNVFLVRLFDNKKVEKFSPIYFLHDITKENNNKISVGFLFDIYYLDNQKWGKVIKIKSINKDEIINEKTDEDYVYLLDEGKIEDINNFVGIVNEKSTIDKLFFEYSQKNHKLEIDDLLQVDIRGNKVFYQIINACTSVEKLENYNEKGGITAEAIQIGCWNGKTMSFDKFGWLPLVNEAVYVANTYDEYNKIPKNKDGSLVIGENEMQIGVIPKTKLPSIIKLDEAVSHHMAILGVTGSGKSIFARKIIENLKDTKVICVDMNEEFHREMNLKPSPLFTDTEIDNFTKKLNYIISQLSEFENRRTQGVSGMPKWKEEQNYIVESMKGVITNFLNNPGEAQIKVLNIPEISNTDESLAYLRYFFKVSFEIAKNNLKIGSIKKLCIVLEEAHTIIPEWNAVGTSDKTSVSLINSIAQISLQGRKYGVGLIVIGQRSANISKTVLTQCNTIVAFKAFDDTSYGFLTNYFGKDIIQSIPNLKDYHAVVYGKGIKTKNPIIIDTTDENEVKSKI